MYKYSDNEINALKRSISNDRLSKYLKATEGDEQRALELYRWNSEVSAAFYTPLQGLEICLRNALHNALTQGYKTQEWYDQANLNDRSLANVASAKDQVMRLHRPVDAPHVVAELSFGFWLSLLNKTYHQQLWIPCLSRAFPHAGLPRGKIHRELDHLRLLRNRIAHHEPIFTRHLEKDYESIIRAISWICMVTSGWIDQQSVARDVLQNRL